MRVRAEAATSPATLLPAQSPPPIELTEKALQHLKKLKAEASTSGSSLLLRVGIKSGGCSGRSYIMDFESRNNITADDILVPYDDGSFELVVNAQSLLYLFGMSLDYSDALIGGGFQFNNPNAKESCGCGKSFDV